MRAPLKPVARAAVFSALAPISEHAYRERPRVRVIAFHDVAPGPESPFPGKMRWLAAHARVVSLSSVFAGEGLEPARLNVALTFDDGYAEHAAFAAPILAELGLPATFFVPSGAVGLEGEEAQRFARTAIRRRSRTFRFMRAEDVAAVAAEPLFAIGGHTRNHVDLGSPIDPARLAAEIEEDKLALEALTGSPLRFFAYPFGGAEHTSPQAQATVRGAGYEAAFTIMPGYWSRAQERFLVGRDSLTIDAPDRSWRAALRGGADPVAWLKWRRDARRRRGQPAAAR